MTPQPENDMAFAATAKNEANIGELPTSENESSATRPVSLGLPDGFSLRDDGVYITRPSAGQDGEPTEEFLCSPIRVTARFHRRDGSGWGRLVAVTSRHGKARLVPVLDMMLQTKRAQVLGGLVDLGLRISRLPKASARVADLLQDWDPPVTKLSANRRGWADERCEAFVLSNDRIIGSQNVAPIATDLSHIVEAIGERGSSEDWKTGVAALCVGNPLMTLTVCQAFAGPLLELLGRDGGGLHLWGRSSQGKTTLQRVAGSVWGGPDFVRGWRTTANALEGTAAACNGMVLILDELGEAEPRAVYEATYMLANGKGKARATSFGTPAPQRSWKVAILSSGEIGIREKIADGGRRAMRGQEVRLIDIAADRRMHGAFDELHGCADGAAFAKLVTRRAASAYGTAGPAFVNLLWRHRERIREMAPKVMVAFRAKAGDRVS